MVEQARTPLQEEIWSALGNIGEFLGGLEGKDEAADEIEAIIHRKAKATSARIAALEGALRPFAELAEHVDEKHRDPRPIIYGLDTAKLVVLTIGDLRSARAALASTDSMKGQDNG